MGLLRKAYTQIVTAVHMLTAVSVESVDIFSFFFFRKKVVTVIKIRVT